jgi:type IX secretion system PorP/SprF family membrane protein
MKRLIQILILMLPLFVSAQHYQHFSQYLLNGLAINPAYAGSREVFSVSSLYRDQWITFPGAPKTLTISAHTPLKKLNSAIGLQAFHDKLGVSKHTGLFFNYAYRIRFKKERTLAMGLSLGFSQFHANLGTLNVTDPGDGVFDGKIYNYYTPNAGMGIYYYSRNFFAGISTPLLRRYGLNARDMIPDSLLRSPSTVYFTTGIVFRLNKDIFLKPSILIKSIPGSEGQADINFCLIVYNTLYMTLSFRTKESLVWIIEYQLNDQFHIAYAHDFVTSSLSSYTHGTNEIMLRYEFVYKSNAVSTRFF